MNYRDFIAQAALDIMCASIQSNEETLAAPTAIVAAVTLAAGLENSKLAPWQGKKEGALRNNSDTIKSIKEHMENADELTKKIHTDIENSTNNEDLEDFEETASQIREKVLFKDD